MIIAMSNHNIYIQEVTNSHISIRKDSNNVFFILSNASDLKTLAEKIGAEKISIHGTDYNISDINELKLKEIINQYKEPEKEIQSADFNNSFKQENFANSLRQGIASTGVPLKLTSPYDHIITFYGWLIEPFLRRLGSTPGAQNDENRLVYLIETYVASFRYLCFIQMANILAVPGLPKALKMREFINITSEEYLDFDYLELLYANNEVLETNDTHVFVKDIAIFVKNSKKGNLSKAIDILKKTHRLLLKNGEFSKKLLDKLLEDCLKSLAELMVNLAFLSKYQIISIKDINLTNRFGLATSFIHLYAELHGPYEPQEVQVQDKFTYNHSVLLLKRNALNEHTISTNTCLSLSPFVIDLSVFQGKSLDTPEVYYYIGQSDTDLGKRFVFLEREYVKSKQSEKPIVTNTFELNPQNVNIKFEGLYQQISVLFDSYVNF